MSDTYMDNEQQLHYLKLLGVPVWVPRSFEYPVEEPVPEIKLTRTGGDVSKLDWNELRATVDECTDCRLHAGRTQAVFGVGNQEAELMVIGEAPGADEDREGEPFVGRAGQLLNEMLFAIGHPRDTVYIANIVKCRPPENRNPQHDEAASCSGYLQRQIELVSPAVILALGKVAAQNLLQSDQPIGKMRGQQFTYGASEVPVIVTYHPAYLLRSPKEKRKTWEDLKQVARVLQS